MTIRYFAYGSNMDPARLHALGVAFSRRRAARLADHALRFDKAASDAAGVAYANVAPSPGAVVEGVLYDIDAAGLASLDAFEDVPRLYRRATRPVQCAGQTVDAEVYLAQPGAVREGLAVEDWYVAHLLAAADLLSPAWVAALRALPVVRTPPRW